MRQSDRRVARRLPLARLCDAFGNLAASFGRRRQEEIGGSHRRHLDMQVDAVDQRAGNACLIIGGTARIGPAPAGIADIVGVAAAARIHRRYQHEARRIGGAMIGAYDRHFAGFQRLAQRIEHLGLEFRQLVEEKHAVMGERNLARPRMQAATDQGRHAGGMMRRPERPPVGQRAALDHAGDRLHHGDFEQLRRRQRRQDRRKPCGQYRLAGAGRPDHEKIVAAGGGHFERALGAFLAL
jgi:hypothetical protein